jgi:tetratricopeptide (TPR) repeat protein
LIQPREKDVSAYSRIRQQQLMQEAEGYLDLIRIASWPTRLDPRHRYRLAERAIAVLDQVAPVEDGRTAYLRGQAYRCMGKYRLALVALRRAIATNPRNIRVHLALAWCYKRVQRLDLAIETLEDALEFEGESPRRRGILHYNLACYWSLANNVGLTLAHLARAFEFNSEYRRRAQHEIDFDPVRHHPEFLALTGAVV